MDGIDVTFKVHYKTENLIWYIKKLVEESTSATLRSKRFLAAAHIFIPSYKEHKHFLQYAVKNALSRTNAEKTYTQ